MYFSLRRILLMVLVCHLDLPAPVRMPSCSSPLHICCRPIPSRYSLNILFTISASSLSIIRFPASSLLLYSSLPQCRYVSFYFPLDSKKKKSRKNSKKIRSSGKRSRRSKTHNNIHIGRKQSRRFL